MTSRSTLTITLVAMALLAVSVWLLFRVYQREAVAIVTIHSLVPGEHGAVRMQYETELRGSRLTLHLARRSGGSEFVYGTDTSGGVIEEMLGWGVRPMGLDDGSYELGECPQSDMVVTPLQIELKRGETFVVAKCMNKEGQLTEFIFSCE